MSRPNLDEQKILQDVSTRAAVDKEFRAKVLAEPHEALAEVAGMNVPSTFRIKFIEKTSDVDALIVLPDFVDNASELSPEELEAVAGGVAENDCWVLSCVTSCGTTCGLISCWDHSTTTPVQTLS